MKIFFVVILFYLLVQNSIFSEIKSPIILENGDLIFTNELDNGIYLLKNDKVTLLTESLGSGRFLTISPDNKYIGFKQINDKGQQSTAFINLDSNKIEILENFDYFAGQLSFSNQGVVAYTNNQNLILKYGKIKEIYPINNYSNIVSISPNSNFIAIQNQFGEIEIFDITKTEIFKSALKTDFTKNRNFNFDFIQKDTDIVNYKKLSDLKPIAKISDDNLEFYNPKWSPDSTKIAFLSTGDGLKLYSINERDIKTISNGVINDFNWSKSSSKMVFDEIDEVLGDSSKQIFKIFSYDINSSNKNIVFSSENQSATTPSFSEEDSSVIFAIENSVYKIDIDTNELIELLKYDDIDKITPKNKSVNITPANGFYLEVPYTHQVYNNPSEVSESVRRSSCAPTSALMGLAYHKVIPHWDNIGVDGVTHWGNYTFKTYRMRGFTFEASASGYTGGYGHMWSGDRSPAGGYLTSFIANHNFLSETKWSATFDFINSHLLEGNPLPLCATIRTLGHVFLIAGVYDSTKKQIYVNDPWGDANKTTYLNRDGKKAIYDWPGANNGQATFTFAWLSTMRPNYEKPEVLIEVDDKTLSYTDVNNYSSNNIGFYLHTAAPSNMTMLRNEKNGENDSYWWTNTTDQRVEAYAVWRPNLPVTGFYEIKVYIPNDGATNVITTIDYEINSADGVVYKNINQDLFKGSWVSLGEYQFNQGVSGWVKLTDFSSIKSKRVYFDNMRFDYIEPTYTAPTLVVTSPQNSLTIEESTITIIGYATDVDSDLSIIGVKNLTTDEYKQVSLSGSRGDFSVTLNLVEGVNSIKISAVDLRELKSSKEIEITRVISNTNLCEPNPCIQANREICILDSSENGYSCDCNSGYILDNDICIEMIQNNPCEPNPCLKENQMVCEIITTNIYSCNCDEGFELYMGNCHPIGFTETENNSSSGCLFSSTLNSRNPIHIFLMFLLSLYIFRKRLNKIPKK
ncbi:hypothetical protein JXR93_11155 [bacterium]|nr:hypothetical protein [bacterium]